MRAPLPGIQCHCVPYYTLAVNDQDQTRSRQFKMQPELTCEGSWSPVSHVTLGPDQPGQLEDRMKYLLCK